MSADTMRAFFEAEQWPYIDAVDGAGYEFAVEGNNGRYDGRAVSWDHTGMVMVRVFAPDAAPPDRVDAVAELAARLNAGLVLGNFDVDLDTGRISFRIGADTQAAPLSVDLLRSLAHTAVLTMDRNAPVIWRVLHGGADASDRLADPGDDGPRPGPGAAEEAARWDARYREHDSMWSGRPNGRLAAEVAELAPGRALDVGCGEGADAIWLAERGWTVTAVDVSAVAVGRGRDAAGRAGVTVEWIIGDALRTDLPRAAFDLVSLQYPALPRAAGEAAVRGLLDAVRPGGVLLAVYHDLDDEHRAHMRERGEDPDDYVEADELERLLGDDFTVELHVTEPRVDPPSGTAHVADVVLRARRR